MNPFCYMDDMIDGFLRLIDIEGGFAYPLGA